MRFEFIYRPVPDGSVCRGTVEAATELSACQGVKDDGGKVLFVVRKGWFLPDAVARLMRGERLFRFGVAPDELCVFCELLQALHACGVTTPRAISTICEETANPWFAKRLGIVLYRISTGDSLSKAMEDRRCRRAFPPRMREAIAEGEAKGDFMPGLSRLAEFYRRKSEQRDLVASHIIPGFGLVCILALIVFLGVVSIVPRMIEGMAKDPNVIRQVLPRFPLPIRSAFFLHDHPLYLLLLPLAFVAAGALWAVARQFRMARVFFSHVGRRLPMLGNMQANFALARFLDGLSERCGSDVQIQEALQSVRRGIGDVLVEDAVSRMQKRMLMSGVPLSAAMNSESVFPLRVKKMVRAGEERGRLGEVLGALAVVYRLQAMRMLKRALHVGTLGVAVLTVWALGLVLGVAMFHVLLVLARTQ